MTDALDEASWAFGPAAWPLLLTRAGFQPASPDGRTWHSSVGSTVAVKLSRPRAGSKMVAFVPAGDGRLDAPRDAAHFARQFLGLGKAQALELLRELLTASALAEAGTQTGGRDCTAGSPSFPFEPSPPPALASLAARMSAWGIGVEVDALRAAATSPEE